MTEELVLVERQAKPGIAVLRLNRPAELNALNLALMTQLRDRLQELEQDDEVRVCILTGNDRAFAAGADIKQMAGRTAVDMWQIDQFAIWDGIRRFKKPLIAAVSGFALGGGCELAMLCDMIVASDTAQFGQPEIKIGVIPGAGGTQRLTRAIGKAKAMELVMSGRFIDAVTAERWGLVNKIVPTSTYLEEALRFAAPFAEMSPLALRAAKEAVNGTYENHLQEGLLQERRNFYLLFSSEDQKEGMAAFIEKRKPNWTGK
jgi:enoyl-CoA hydratase